MTELDEHCWDDVIGPDERLIARQFQSDRPLGSRPALLLIDCYQKVFGDRPLPLEEAVKTSPTSCGPAAWEALPSLEKLLGAAREAGLPVIHTTGETRRSGQLGGATLRKPGALEDELAGYEIVPSLAPVEGELVARKTRASAFFGTPLTTWLTQLGVDTLFVAGETTSGCVRASVVDGYSHGYRMTVVEEATFDRSTLSHKINLFDMNLKYASVRHLDEVLTYLAGARRDAQEVAGG